jgi:hypothetical protein
MNSQLTHPPAHLDNRIDHVLEALRTTEAPAGLEERVAQRIAARLAQAAEARQSNPAQARTLLPSFPAAKDARPSTSLFTLIRSLFTTRDVPASTPTPFFAVILNAVKDPRILLAKARLYPTATVALALLIALTAITVLHRRTSTSTYTPTQPATLAQTSVPLHGQVPQVSSSETPTTVANIQVPRGFSLGSHSPTKRAGVLTPAPQSDPDTIALAETLAPSQPAPPMPLTPQEQLMAAATRPGQPIQLAELDLTREPILRAAEKSHEEANLRRYIRSLLAPFALADSLSPTTFSQPQEIAAPAPAPHPSTSLSN